jgi:PhnB protein
MRVSPHLTFDGQCKSAFLAYQRILGGDVLTMLSYGESPMASTVDKQWHDHILHATLTLGDIELTGADTSAQGFTKPQGFFITLSFNSLDKAKAVFEALSEQGEVHLPFGEAFWSPGYGVVTDCFGTPWEVNAVQAIP